MHFHDIPISLKNEVNAIPDELGDDKSVDFDESWNNKPKSVIYFVGFWSWTQSMEICRRAGNCWNL